MASRRESGSAPPRKDVPLDAVLEPLREILQAIGEVQRRSESALKQVVERIEAEPDEETGSEGSGVDVPAPSTASSSPAAQSGGEGDSRVLSVRHQTPRDAGAAPEPAGVHAPRDPARARADQEEGRTRPAPWQRPTPPASARDRDSGPSPSVTSATGEGDRPPSGERSSAEPRRPEPSVQAPATDEDRPATPAGEGDARILLRRSLAQIQRAANEIDRITDSDALTTYLWDKAAAMGLRVMRLQEKGRALYAEDCEGFLNFEGDRRSRLRKVVIPFDPDGLFGVTAQERSVYSGPRPARGLPVDLVLVMGKQAPAWCLVVPLPYRNRWGTFLYVDAPGEKLEAILELELVARFAVLQLRAARFRPHEPAERVRTFRASTLRERQRRRARRRGGTPPAAASTADEVPADPLSRKKNVHAPLDHDEPERDILTRPEPERFDADGNLIRPLDGATILSRMGELPPMPHVATRLIGLLNDPETEVSTLQEIMSTDQAISVRLLQIANSSLYGNMREANTIAEAVMRLGFTAVRSWLLATVTRSMFVAERDDPVLHRLWRQSVLCGLAAQLLAERGGNLDPDVAFTGGLLQNIGQLLLARNHPDVFTRIDEQCHADRRSYFEVEREVLGFDHADLGGLILQKWNLGDTLVGAISSHHRLGSAGSEAGLAAVIALAEELSLRVGEGPTEASDDDLAEIPAAVHLGLDSEAVEELALELGRRALDRSLFQS